MIENKYTIEYIKPESDRENKSISRKSILSFIFSGILLTALVFLVLTNLPEDKNNDSTIEKPSLKEKNAITNNSTTKANQVAPTLEKQNTIQSAKTIKEKEAVPLGVEKTSIINTPDTINKKISANKLSDVNSEASERPTSTKDIEKNLALLKKQLLETQKKNKELATELDAQIMENMELSTLLEDSLYKINKKDKSYINELEKLEKNTISAPAKTPLKEASVTIDIKDSSLKKVAKKSSKPINPSPRTKGFNQVDLSTSSQVNAIIAAMKNKKNTSTGKLISESSKVERQEEINQVINNKNTDEINNAQKPLDKI